MGISNRGILFNAIVRDFRALTVSFGFWFAPSRALSVRLALIRRARDVRDG